ncbi:MAG: serine protease [Verrucomicrobiota bacterium]|jgi:hypothetical protein
MNWDSIVQKVSPYVVKIETPDGNGTGFVALYSEDKTWCGIATALHVVGEADAWQKPIKIHAYNFIKPPLFLPEGRRIIFTDWKTDSAVIFFQKSSDLKLPEDLVSLRPINAPLTIGVELGWMGFPFLEPWTLCFFSGNISARQEDRNTYLIDGAAIKGVSGGPVIFSSVTDGVQFIGVVSAYRAGGESLPGLLYAHDVSHFHSVLSTVKSWDEAKKKKAEEEAKKKQVESTPAKPIAHPAPAAQPAKPAEPASPASPSEPAK